MNFTYTLGRKNTFGKVVSGTITNRSVGRFYAIGSSGKSRTWGSYNEGSFGDNSLAPNFSPKILLKKTFLFIDARSNHTLALDKNGRAWSWGSNSAGQLGDNSVNSRLTPVSVAGAVKTFCKISGGLGFSIGLDNKGIAWTWGNGQYGQLGDNSIISKRTPVSVCGTKKTFCEIAGGIYDVAHGCAIDKNGQAWSWGYNDFRGFIGNNSNATFCYLTPVSVCGTAKTFCKISASADAILVIDKNGKCWGWGQNYYGTLGINLGGTKLTPTSILGTTKTFCRISAGGRHSFGIDKNGQAWAWGYNGFGQLGNNSTTNIYTPVSVCGTKKTFCEIFASGNISDFSQGDRNLRTGQSMAIDYKGGVWAWGYNITRDISWYIPQYVSGTVKTFCKVSVARHGGVAIDKNGKAWSWGEDIDSYGVLGNNLICSISPIPVQGASKTFCQIAVGFYASLGLDKNGKAWSWGRNTSGILGNNGTVSQITPVSVCGTAKTFCKITVGIINGAAIDKNGQVWCWGANGAGQLGNNSTTAELTPVSICGTKKTFCEISTSNAGFSAIDKNGQMWSWGANNGGQLGIGNVITAYCTPVSVCGTKKTFCSIFSLYWEFGIGNSTSDDGFMQAIDKNGQIWSWGRGVNDVAMFGNNNPFEFSRGTPISVCGATKTFCKISTDHGYYSMAVDKNGKVWTWGTNVGSIGAMGEPTYRCANTPVNIPDLINKTFCSISVGNNFTAAIDKNGRLWAWGRAYNHEIGTDAFYAKTPVKIF